MHGSVASVRALCAAAVLVTALGLALPRESSAQTPTPMPTPGGDCCSPHGGPSCDVAACSNCVCGNDPVCCRGPWDEICVADTTDCADTCLCNQTPVPTPTPGGPCCAARDPDPGGTGCDDSTCQACVCGIDPDCCNHLWDATCASEAMVECLASCPCMPPATATPTPIPTPGGDCCTAHGGPSCDDNTCRTCVCNLDSECCNTLWDQTCTDEASVECALSCQCPGSGDCCAPHDGVGCNDATCKDCVCNGDTFDPSFKGDASCCTEGQGWDADCVSEANVECVASCTCQPKGVCCDAHENTIGCDDRRCQLCVCTIDTSCCADGWDATCASEAAHECQERCSGCGSDCCIAHDQAGCSDDACKTCVCGVDSFCCDQLWDGSCVDIANGDPCTTTCACSASTPSCPGDCANARMVMINDLIRCVNIALDSTDLSTCSACDVDGNGMVEINELIMAVNAALTGCPS